MAGLSVAMALACIAVVYVGAVVQASVGIGLGMIASPVLLLADPAFIPVTIMLAVLPLTFTIAWVDREHIEPREVGFALAGRVPGVVAGALVVAALSDRVLAILVAASVLLAVVASITGRLFQPTDRALVVAGDESVYQGRVDVPSYIPAEDFAGDSTHFWRVDEINADESITAGAIWSFSVRPSVLT